MQSGTFLLGPPGPVAVSSDRRSAAAACRPEGPTLSGVAADRCRGSLLRFRFQRATPTAVATLTETSCRIRSLWRTFEIERAATDRVDVEKIRYPGNWSTLVRFRKSDGSQAAPIFVPIRPARFRRGLIENGWPVFTGKDDILT